jgi:diketogulonate reductase-like aldo/keto reductase
VERRSKTPREALQESLEKLQLDFVDLYLMHWPVPAIDHYVDAWKGMIELQKEGLVKSIGVCNFQVHHLQRLIDETGVAPVINQIELHPLMQQRQLAWNATHKIQTESWSPLAQGGEGYSIRKLSVSWRINTVKPRRRSSSAGIWTGLVVIPKSVTPSRIAENFDVWDFRLDKDELGEIAKLDQGKRLGRTRISLADNRVKKPGGGCALPGLRVDIKPRLAGVFIYALRFTGFFASLTVRTLMHNRRVLGQRRARIAVLATRFAHLIQRRGRYQTVAARANQVFLPISSSAWRISGQLAGSW